MTNTTNKIVLGVLGILALLGALSFFGVNVGDFSTGAINSGTSVINYPQWLTNGFYAGNTQQMTIDGSGRLLMSTTGTNLSRVNFGTCYFNPYATTIAATSSATVDCQGTQAIGAPGGATTSALTGVSVNDNIIVQLSTTTSFFNGSAAISGSFGGLEIISANGSTTAGHIELRVWNQTGKTYTFPTAGAASGTATYLDLN